MKSCSINFKQTYSRVFQSELERKARSINNKKDLENYLKNIYGDIDESRTLGKSDLIYILNFFKTFTDDPISQIASTIENIDYLIPKYSESVIENKSFNFNNISKFIPNVSEKINNYLYKQIQVDLFKILIYNSDSLTIVGLNGSIQDSIKGFKNNLFNILAKWTGNDSELYDLDSDYINFENYNSVMQLANFKLNEILQQNREYNQIITLDTLNEFINPLYALYVLNNFDEVLKQLAPSVININSKYDGKLNIFDDKYSLQNFKKSLGSYQDNFNDLDSEKLFTNLFKSFLQTIPNGKGGFASIKDAISIFKQIHVLSTETNSNIIRDIISNNKDFNYRKDQLLNLLAGNLIKGLDRKLLDSLHYELTKYNETFKKAINDENLSSEEKRILSSKYDFVGTMVHYLLNSKPLAYEAITENGVEIKTLTKVLKNKSHIFSGILERLANNLSSDNVNIYNSDYFLPGFNVSVNYLSLINDDTFIKYIKDLTGIDLKQNNLLKKLISDDKAEINIKKLNNFIESINEAFQEEIRPYYLNNGEVAKEFIYNFEQRLKFDSRYIDFTSFLVEDDDMPNYLLYDLQFNTQPSMGVNTLVSNFYQNLEDFKTQIPYPETSNNILAKYPSLYSSSQDDKLKSFTDRIVYRQDIKYSVNGLERFVQGSKLYPEESLDIAINYDFLGAFLEYGIMLNQIECVSNKVRIPLGVFNVSSTISDKNISERPINFYKLTVDQIKKLYYKQRGSYFDLVLKEILTIGKKLFRNNVDQEYTLKDYINDLNTINDYVDTYNQTHSDKITALEALIDLVIDYNDTHNDNIELKFPIHYVLDSNKKLTVNNILYAYFIDSNNDFLNECLEEGLQETIKSLESNKIKFRFNYSELSDENKIKFKELLGLNLNDSNLDELLSKIFNTDRYIIDNFENIPNNSKLKEIRNIFINKYFYLQQLFTEADLQISSKYQYVHNSKKNTSLKDLEGPKQKDIVKKLISDSLLTTKKRNNSLSASFLPMVPYTTYGVGRTMKIVNVLSQSQNLTNYNGDRHRQDVHDGSLWTNGIFEVWERHSYGDKIYEHTKKTIGIVPEFSSITQYKLADNVITNELIRESFKKDFESGNQDLSKYDFYEIFKKFNSYNIDLSDFVFNNNFRRKLYLNIDGVDYQLLELNKSDEYSNVLILKLQNSEGDIGEQEFVVNTVFDLWSALGGAYSKEMNDLGELEYSNISQEITADLISESSKANAIKEGVIAKMVDISASKSAIVNPLSISQFKRLLKESKNLIYHKVNTDRYGVQLDYTHQADDSDIAALTQMMSALSFFGENINSVNDLYNDLAQIVALELDKVDKKWGDENSDHYEYHLDVAKSFVKSLQTTAVSTNAMRIATETLEKLIKEKGSDNLTILPYSNPEIFNKLTSNIITKLNSTLRQRFSGIAIIQKPSLGIIGIYEDINGKTYKRTDLIKIGQSLVLDISDDGIIFDDSIPEFIQEKLIESYNNDNINDFYINVALFDSRFSDRDIDINDIRIGDTIRYELNGEIFTTEIKEPEQYIKLFEQNISNIKRIHRVLRDLRVSHVFFKENGKLVNYWLSDCIREKLKLPKNKIIGLWHKANLKGLGTKENPYYYKTLNDFLRNKPTYVSGVVYENGELVLPKTFKSKMHLNHSLAEIRDTGPSYFEKYLINKYNSKLNLPNINLYKKKKQLLDKYKDKHNLHIIKDDLEIIYTNSKDYLEELFKANPGSIKIDLIEDNKVLIDPETKLKVSKPVYYNGNTKTEEYYKIVIDGKPIYFILDTNSNIKGIEKTLNDLSIKILTDLYINDESVNSAKSTLGLQKLTYELNEYKDDFDFKKLSLELYTSFLITLRGISTRIPSQSLQSFMANKTVAFTDEDTNEGYINIWEIWFTGGDFDIDKSYTLMYELDKFGRVKSSSPLTDYTSVETLEKSLRLPRPNKNALIKFTDETNFGVKLYETLIFKYFPLIKSNEYFESEIEIIFDENLNLYIDKNSGKPLRSRENIFKDLYSLFDELNNLIEQFPELKIDVYNDLLKIHNTESNLTVDKNLDKDSNFYKFISNLNKHNSYNISKGGLKNRITQKAWDISSDIKNLEHSTQPMDSEPANIILENIEKELGIAPKIFSDFSPTTKFEMQYKNSVGSENVGIAANSVKADAAIQQYFNEFYQRWKPEVELYDKYKTDFKVKINIKGKELLSKKFTKFANVVLTKDQFLKLYENISDEELSQESDYKLLKIYLDNKNISNDELLEIFASRSKLNQDLEIVKLFISQNSKFTLTRENYLDFLWFKNQFEDSAADYLSIFISWAVDNAKELKLERINATPELMSIPLAMIIMGIDMNTVITTGVEIMKDIASTLQVNRINADIEQLDVRSSIDKLKDLNKYDSDTIQSIKDIYNFATEVRIISSFFKVNQGVNAKYSELLKFIEGLSKLKKDLDNQWLLKEADFIKTLDDSKKIEYNELKEEFLGKNINFDKFLNDLNYRERLIKFTDFTKVGLNYIAVIANSPNFMAQLKAVNSYINQINKSIFKAKLANELITSSEKLEEAKRDLQPNESLIITESKPKEKINKEYLRSRYVKVVDHLIISKFLLSKNLSKFNFSVSELDTLFDSNLTRNYGENVRFDISNETGMKMFIDVMNEYIIPKLKSIYENNFFFRSLEKERHYEYDKYVYQIKYDIFDKNKTSIDLNSLNQCKVEFNQIINNSSGLNDLYGNKITIGDLFYLYNLILYKNDMNALNTVIKEGVEENSELPKILDEFYRKFDYYNINNNIINEESEYFRLTLEDYKKLYFIKEALANKSKSYSLGKYSINLNNCLNYFSRELNTSAYTIKRLKEECIKLTGKNYINFSKKTISITGLNTKFVISSDSDITEDSNIGEETFQDILGMIKFRYKTIEQNLVKTNINSGRFTLIPESNLDLEDDTPTNKLISYVLKDCVLIKSNQSQTIYPIIYQYDNYLIIPENNDLITSNSIYELIDSIIKIKQNSGKTELTQEESKLNLFNYLEQNIDSKSFKTLKEGYEKYKQSNIEEDLLKDKGLLMLESFSIALQNPEIYYKTDNLNKEVLLEGDLFEILNKTYLYLGFVSGTTIFVNLTDNKIVYNLKYKKEQKKAQLRINKNYFINDVKFPSTYNANFANKKLEEINIGDVIKENKKEYLVVDIIFESGQKLLVVKNRSTKKLELFNNKEYNQVYSSDLYNITYNAEDNLIIFNFQDLSKNIQDKILNKINKYTEIEFDKGEGYFFITIDDSGNYILKNGGSVYSISKDLIKSIMFKTPVHFDEEFELSTLNIYTKDPLKYINRRSYEIDPSIFINRIYLNKYRPYSISKNESLQTSVNKDDIIILKKGSDITYLKVLEKSNQNITYLEIKDGIQTIKITSNLETDIGNFSLDLLIFTKNPRLKVDDSNKLKLTNKQKEEEVLNKLSEKFQMPIIINDNLESIAVLTDRGIEINKNADILSESIHEFLHLFLANYRSINPEGYYMLILVLNEYKNKTEFKLIYDNLDTKIYDSETYKLEETLIRYISEHNTFNSNLENDIDLFENIKNIINISLANILNINLTLSNIENLFFNLEHAIYNLKNDFFTEITKDFDLNRIRLDNINLSFFDNVKYVCK